MIFRAVDSLQIHRRDAEVGMPQLALDDDQRDLLMGERDGVRMPQLMGAKRRLDPCRGGGSSQLPARGRLLPIASGGRAVDHEPQSAYGEPDAELLPGFELLPRPTVDQNLATLIVLAVADEHRSAAAVKIGPGQRERLADPQSRPPQEHDQRPQPDAIRARARGAHDRDDLLHGRRVGGVAPALVAGRATRVIARQGHGLPRMAGRIKQDRVRRAPPG